jgi:cytosine/adenosine deaminase-related metal-dependent hydrolase
MTHTPNRGTFLIDGGTVVSVDPDIGILERGQVLIDEGVIVEVGTGISAPDAERIDATDCIVMPGLIDSHFLMWSSIGRNFVAQDYGYFAAKWDTGPHYRPDDYYISVLLASVEALNAGITTVHNWSHNIMTPEHADAELRALGDALIRARYSYGHRDGLPADEPLSFDDIDRVRAAWFTGGAAADGLVTLGVNLRGPDIADADVFPVEMGWAQERGLPVSIHAEQGGSTRIDAAELERLGYLGPDFLICHYMPASDADMQVMARTDTPLSYAVHSELNLGVAGDPRDALLRFRDAGVTISLSIDATSIAPVNLFEAMNIAWNMGIPWEGTRTAGTAPLSFAQVIEMATINGARALNIDRLTGSLTPGKRADLIAIRATDLNVAPAVDVESTIVRSVTPANVDTVIVDGRIVKRAGKLVAHDAQRIVADATAAAAAVRERAAAARQA